MTLPEISLADLLLAFGRLDVQGADERRSIARILGLSRAPEPERSEMPSTPVSLVNRPSRQAHQEQPHRPMAAARRPQVTLPPDPEREAVHRPSRLDAIAESGRSAPPRQVPALAALLNEGPPPIPMSVEPSLFVERWRRALLTTVLSTSTHDGPVDAEAVVRRVGRGDALLELPRLPLPTMRHGVQLLVDRRPGMRPYAEDQERLRRHIGQVAGQDGLRIAWFSGCPARGLEPEQRSEADIADGFNWEPEVYAPPEQRVPVLLLSDLGIGAVGTCPERADQHEWVEFARRVRTNGNRLLAFVPFPTSRWPRQLSRLMTLVEWDRSTSVGVIRRLLSGGGG